MILAPNSEPVFGIHPIEEAVRAGRTWWKLFLKDDRGERASLVALARERGVPLHFVPERELDKLSHGGHHQGAVAMFAPFAYAEWIRELARLASQPTALVLALDGVKDPGNLGQIVRTAVAAGVDVVILPKDRSALVTPAVMRASAGAATRIPIVQVVNLSRALAAAKQAGFWVFGAAGEAAAPIWKADLRGKIVWVLGEEHKGMRRLVRETCDALYRIPMPGGFDSLNVAAAAAVVLFETVRQRAVGRETVAPRGG